MNETCASNIIKSYYKGYKSRKALNNIFKKLPCDLQDYIKDKYFREDYYNNYIEKLTYIVNNRVFTNTNEFLETLSNNRNTFLEYCYNNQEKLYYTCYLCKKYDKLIDSYKVDTLKRIFRKLNLIIVEKYHFDNSISLTYKNKLQKMHFKCIAYLTLYNII